MSQVTKPIALDETLQDVVSAIQGITQGGMIVSTGNVGSSTQPVYINGGVPTAGMNFAITTGTPTNIHTALTTQGHTFFHKSGNVVVFRLSVTIGSGFTANRTTKICDLPWTPSEQVLFDRGVSTSGDGPYTHGYSYVNGTTSVLYLGTLPFTDIAQGSTMHINGTYLTNA